MNTRLGLLCDYKTVDVIDHVSTGAKMRQARKGYGVSLRSLAKAMNLTAPYLSDLELGRRNWDDKRVLAFNHALTCARVKSIQEATKSAHKSILKLD